MREITVNIALMFVVLYCLFFKMCPFVTLHKWAISENMQSLLGIWPMDLNLGENNKKDVNGVWRVVCDLASEEWGRGATEMG